MYRNFIDNYVSEASKTLRKSDSTEDIVLNMKFGIIGELGEVYDCVKKTYFQGHELNAEKLSEEIGDTFWYLMIYDSLNGRVFTDEMITMAPTPQSPQDLIELYPDDVSNQRKVLECLMGFCSMFGLDPIEIMRKNIRKLRHRYGNTFSEQRSINRKDK